MFVFNNGVGNIKKGAWQERGGEKTNGVRGEGGWPSNKLWQPWCPQD